MRRNPHVNRARPGEATDTFARLLTIETDECVLWPFATNSKGYGQLFVDGASRSVHVLACSHHHGPRPRDTQAAHRCGVNRCVNRRHIYWATHEDNRRDKAVHRIYGRGAEGLARLEASRRTIEEQCGVWFERGAA